MAFPVYKQIFSVLRGLVMGVREFLESSSIHGLSYIASSNRCTRLFWTFVIFSGFSGAFYLINQAFNTWAETPISTTIEMLPIKNLKFPNVTVCPPKHTFTNLNYDVSRGASMTIEEETRNRWIEYTFQLIHDPIFNKFWDDMSIIEEEKRFHNWYHGYTQILPPHYEGNQLVYAVVTENSRGKISTRDFGKEMNKEKVIKDFLCAIYFFPAFEENENSSLEFKIKKQNFNISLNNIREESYDNFVWTDPENKNDNFAYNQIDAHINEASKNYSNFEDFYVKASLLRNISERELEKSQIQSMPGFEIKWETKNSIPINTKTLMFKYPRFAYHRYILHFLHILNVAFLDLFIYF